MSVSVFVKFLEMLFELVLIKRGESSANAVVVFQSREILWFLIYLPACISLKECKGVILCLVI